MNTFISIILPLYNGYKYIRESIKSIIDQTYQNWEFIIVNDFGSADGSVDIIREYIKVDPRIVLIQNKERLGLAESLNIGIRNAKGKYIARVDVDDLSYPERLEKQVEYLDLHPEAGLCGTLQRSVLPDRSYDQIVPCDPEELKAALLFGCEISHCSVMFRRELFIRNNWYYDPNSLAEDYDLWTKIMFKTTLVNLPEVLVDHRWGFDNISIDKGEKLIQESRNISARTLKDNFDIVIDDTELPLLSGWRSKPEVFAKKHRAAFLTKGFQLLEKIRKANDEVDLIDQHALEKVLYDRWNWICNSCGLFFKELPYSELEHSIVKPKISIVLPVYQAVTTLRETIDSVLAQVMKEWELIIVCDFGNLDGSTEIAKAYSLYDSRIRVIENSEKKGLAESLNIGIKQASCSYIARIDADDLMNASRLKTQYQYMEKHKSVGISQLYQHYFGPDSHDFIHRPPQNSDDMKAKLLFFCDACHSTVMFRKSIIDQYDLYYKNVPLEDYDLWLRAVRVTEFVTIPEIYGEYRVGISNITNEKHVQINQYMGKRIAEELQDNLGISIAEEDYELLSGWNNAFLSFSIEQKELKLQKLKSILEAIWNSNKKIHYYNSSSLLKSLNCKWRWAKNNESWHNEQKVKKIDDIFLDRDLKNSLFRSSLKTILSGVQKVRIHKDRKVMEHQCHVTENIVQNYSHLINQQTEHWTWERFQRTEQKLKGIEKQNQKIIDLLTDEKYSSNKIPYIKGEQIRIVFLFQIASFWPSWETLYFSCMEDPRIDIKLIFLNETKSEISQMKTAEQFLKTSGLDYTLYEDFDIVNYSPHVMVIQTPYDEWHRQENHWAQVFKASGYRLVYIPYGIELSDTDESHELHFNTNVIRSCWRIYTFSTTMLKDYRKYCVNASAVRAIGLPRFDLFAAKEKMSLPEAIEQKRKGRKIVLWKVHFSKTFYDKSEPYTVTPTLDEYLSFSEKIRHYKDFFFIFMPHPKFRDMAITEDEKQKIQIIWDNVEMSENACIDEDDDYRRSLLNADFIITDRSAVMVEAGALDVPVLYMTNDHYFEPLTDAIKDLVNSYYQGSTCDDICRFIDNCKKERDPKAKIRKQAFESCIPNNDGHAGERIKEDIIYGVIHEE